MYVTARVSPIHTHPLLFRLRDKIRSLELVDYVESSQVVQIDGCLSQNQATWVRNIMQYT